MKTVKDYYQNRFKKSEYETRIKMWKILCEECFQKHISPKSVVFEFGAGYCEFINNIKASCKYAVDINPDIERFANSNIRIINKSALKIPKKYYSKADVVFMSNFLEHLNTKEEVIEVLNQAKKVLKKDGKILILQPNIDLTKEAYWDFIDHKVALNKNSLIEALEIVGFRINNFAERFLPYTTKSALPVYGFLIRLYCRLPYILRPFAGQSFVVGIKK